jgi:VWFA-related protein
MSALRSGVCLLLVASLSGTVGAQAPQRLILDVTAIDAIGAPVTTLRPQDLSLRVNGRVHPVTDLVLVQHEHQPPSPLPAPYATNQVTPGRTMAIAVDVTRLPASTMPAVHDGVAGLLKALHSHDRVALVAMALDGFALDFTTRHERVRATTAALKGRVAMPTNAREAEAAAAASLGMLQRLVTGLAIERGLKTVIFVSSPFATSSTIRRAIQSVADAAAQQRVRLFIVEARDATSASGIGLAALAAATGAELLPAGAGLSTVAGRSATRYELAFSPSSKLSHDTPQRIQLASLRADVRVTAPASIVIPRGEAMPLGMVALTDMLGQSRAYRDLPLRLAVYPVMDTDRDRLRLVILGETEDPSRTLAWAELALIAPSGAVVSRWRVESADAAARPLMTAALAPEGGYRLRMAASELSGRRGTVDVEFDARLTPAGAFALGPVMFGRMSAEAFVPQLQPPAETSAIMAYAEIYGESAATDTWTATFEIAHTAAGPARATIAGSVRKTPDARRRAALGTLDLTALAAGDYQIRAIVSRNGTEIGRVTQTLRKAAQ